MVRGTAFALRHSLLCRSPPQRLGPWLPIAALIHGGLFAALPWLAKDQPETGAPVPPSDFLDVLLVPEEPAPVVASDQKPALTGTDQSESARPASRLQSTTRAVPRRAPESPQGSAGTQEPKGNSAEETQALSDSGKADDSVDVSPREPRDTGLGPRPPLTRAQLGLNDQLRDALLLEGSAGPPPGGSAGPSPERPPPLPKALAAERRLAQSMAEEAAHRDLQIGLGPEGPILKALELATRRVAHTPDEGSALFSIRLDENGKIASFKLLEANGQFDAWEEVGRTVAGSLAATKRKLPDGARGLDLKILVESRLQLPSGRAPGFDWTLGGFALGKKKPPPQGRVRSGVDLLKPEIKITTPELVDDAGRPVVTKPQLRVQVNVLSLKGDLADLGAAAQRIVRSRVVRQNPL